LIILVAGLLMGRLGLVLKTIVAPLSDLVDRL
jgi:hypothetical protein